MGKLTAMRRGKSSHEDFERFIRPHFATLYQRAYRLTRNTADAEDLVQELCIRAYRLFDELRAFDNPKAWLMRVLYRLFVDARRRAQRSRELSLHAIENDASMAIADDEPGPEEQTQASSLQRKVLAALKILPPAEQALLVLRDVEGYSLAEIEQITELPASTLKSRLHRARVKLGRLLRNIELDSVTNSRGSTHELPRCERSAG